VDPTRKGGEVSHFFNFFDKKKEEKIKRVDEKKSRVGHHTSLLITKTEKKEKEGERVNPGGEEKRRTWSLHHASRGSCSLFLSSSVIKEGEGKSTKNRKKEKGDGRPILLSPCPPKKGAVSHGVKEEDKEKKVKGKEDTRRFCCRPL